MAKLTTEEFIAKAKAVHGDRYDYSKVEYVNNQTKVCLCCIGKKENLYISDFVNHYKNLGYTIMFFKIITI